MHAIKIISLQAALLTHTTWSIVYYENFFSIEEAILREKQIKKWNSVKKENLINSMNTNWIDLWIEIEKW